MKEGLNPGRQEQKEGVRKLSTDEIESLLKKYEERGLKEDPKHSEYFKIITATGETHLPKRKTIGFDPDGKPKPIAMRIEELLGLRPEEWYKE